MIGPVDYAARLKLRCFLNLGKRDTLLTFQNWTARNTQILNFQKKKKQPAYKQNRWLWVVTDGRVKEDTECNGSLLI